MWDISRIGQYGILLLGISSEASRRRGMEKVNSFREPVGAAGFCAIWQRNGEAGIRKKQHNCKLIFGGETMTREEIKNMKENALASCTTLDTMRDFVVRACDALLEDSVMQSYFKVENWLYGDGGKKPVEIQSAMLWGALMVAHHHGDIDWDRMREMYGEFMSKKMDLH